MQRTDALRGVIEIASMPVQFFPSRKDPSRKTPATPDERVETVNEGWGEKWFKYVTPETWESNNYPAEMFANDPGRREQVRQQVEAVPLQVKIRYLCEFMASDDTSKLSQLNVPLLALRPGFSEKLLADPSNSWYTTSFQDSWDTFSVNPRIQLLTIPNARALILDDQPKLTDEAIATFVALASSKAELKNPNLLGPKESVLQREVKPRQNHKSSPAVVNRSAPRETVVRILIHDR